MAKEIDPLAEMKAQLRAEFQGELDALKASQLSKTPGEQALALLAERSAPRENPDYNERSAFTHPEGERLRPKPQLSRETFFCGSRCRQDDLTPAEIDAFNVITSSRTARDGQWTAEVRQNGSARELHITVPSKTVDDRMSLPSLLLILAELQGGAKSVDPMALAARVAELEQTLQSLVA